jgi:tetratricopeptide (TPR) repeat protein
LLAEAAEVAWLKANFNEVDSLIHEMMRVSPGYPPARQLRAALFAQNGDCDHAVADATAALSGDLPLEQAAEAHAVLAECLGRQGKADDALHHVDQALTADKIAEVPDYHVLRAFLLRAKGRLDEADREAVAALELSAWDPLVVAALRERGLPRLVEVESHSIVQEAGNVVVRGVVRNRGPIALGEITVTAEGRDPSGAVLATGTATVTPAKLVPGQTGAFHIVLEGAPASAAEFVVRVVDYREP